MIERMKGLFKDEEGATMVEYALMLALIAAVCIIVVGSLGRTAKGTFGTVDTEMGGPTE